MYRTPGQLIKGLLEERGWNQRVLAIILGLDQSIITKLVSDRRKVDADMALALAEVFETSPDRFLDLQKEYDLARARIIVRPDPGRSTRAYLFGSLPIAEMIKRGWLKADDVRNVPAVEAALMTFFGVASVDEIEVLPHAAKKTAVNAPATPAQIVWIHRVRQIAEEMMVGRYSPAAVATAIPRLGSLLAAAEEARKVPRILAECGIRFVIVEALPGAKIDGVTFWLNDLAPVIGMTLRHDRMDNFWFVLRHELEHVLRRDGRIAIAFDAELEGKKAGTDATLPAEERAANEAAADFCIPAKSFAAFVARKAPFFAERDILGFAKTLGIHPALVAGQLQHYTSRYDRFRAHQVKIRSIVTPRSPMTKVQQKQGIHAVAADASLQLVVSHSDPGARAAYENEIQRIEAAWTDDFAAGRLTPLAYYRRLRCLPLDYLAYRTGISLEELDAIDDGPDLPTPEQDAQLAAILGVDASTLMRL